MLLVYILDGTYREHGRELFDEEVSMKSKDASSKSKKVRNVQVCIVFFF